MFPLKFLGNADLLERGFVMGYITRLHPVHVPNYAIFADMVRLCQFDGNRTARTLLKVGMKDKY